MPACSPLDLAVEIPWPDLNAPDGSDERTLPSGNAALERVLCPRTGEVAPTTLVDLAERLLPPHGAAERSVMGTESNAEDGVSAADPHLTPSMQGITLAARFLAFRRGAKTTAPRDVLAALALACPASFAAAVMRRNPSAASALERRRKRLTKALAAVDADLVWLLALFGPHIHPGALSTVVPALRDLLGSPALRDSGVFMDANALTAHALHRIIPDSMIDAVLVDRDAHILVTDLLGEPQVDTVRGFLWRVFSATIGDDAVRDAYVDQVLSDAGIASSPLDGFFERHLPPRPPRSVSRRPLASDRAERGVIAMARLLPHQPSLVSLLVGKATLLGTDMAPAPILLSGGSAEERRAVLSTLATATDAAFVAVDAANLGGQADARFAVTGLLTNPRTLALPAAHPVVGTIILVDGCDDMFVHEDFELDWYRLQRVGAQRALAHLLTHGIPTPFMPTVWPQAPLFFVCGTDEDVPLTSWHSARAMVPALRDQLRERERMPVRASIALMVDLLRPFFLSRIRRPPSGAGRGPLPDRFEVPEATLAAAARLAHRRRASVQGARRAIEAAARRAVLRGEERESSARLVIAPDDLSAWDVTE